jgi:6-phosphogluconolactonase
MAKLTVVDDEEALARAAAGRVTTLIEHAIGAQGSAVVCLTGGSTPRRLYELLGTESEPWRRRIEWSRVHLFWGDERHVPPEHPQSNFGMAKAAILERVPVAAAHVHRMRGEIDARDAATEYDATLRNGFTVAGRSDQRFDLMLLGLGEDAHIASIFPGSELLKAPGGPEGPPVHQRPPLGGVEADLQVGLGKADRVTAVWAPHLNAWRITLTPAALLEARTIVLVVAGTKKAGAVHAALEAPLDVSQWPAQLLRQAGDRVEWFIDRAAAATVRASLPPPPSSPPA